MAGVSAASDIWSVGCTVIELLTSQPPYHDLQPMPALFRIVQDDHPPLPEGISPVAEDFLHQCFRKDPKLRLDAEQLLQHPWIAHARKNVANETSSQTPRPVSSISREKFQESSPVSEGRL